MTNYRRHYRPGGTYFFTLTLADRRSDWLVRHIDLLRTSIRSEQLANPFRLAAWVVLPEHMHLLMRLPEGDFSNRLRRIKAGFSRSYRYRPKHLPVSYVKASAGYGSVASGSM